MYRQMLFKYKTSRAAASALERYNKEYYDEPFIRKIRPTLLQSAFGQIDSSRKYLGFSLSADTDLVAGRTIIKQALTSFPGYDSSKLTAGSTELSVALKLATNIESGSMTEVLDGLAFLHPTLHEVFGMFTRGYSGAKKIGNQLLLGRFWPTDILLPLSEAFGDKKLGSIRLNPAGHRNSVRANFTPDLTSYITSTVSVGRLPSIESAELFFGGDDFWEIRTEQAA